VVRKINDAVNLKLGYSHMLGSDTMLALKGGSTDETSNWAWIMIDFHPSVLIK
jgi:hypothetical protein